MTSWGKTPMGKKTVKLDPDDGLIIGEVGPWAAEKARAVAKIYSSITRRTRKVLATQRDGWRELHRVVFGRWPIADYRHKSNHRRQCCGGIQGWPSERSSVFRDAPL